MIKILNALQCSTVEFFICRAETGKCNMILNSRGQFPEGFVACAKNSSVTEDPVRATGKQPRTGD